MALTKIDDRGLNTPIDLLDNEKIRFGTGNDLEVYHDGTNSFVDGTTTGDLYLRATNDDIILSAADDAVIQVQGSENAVLCNGDGNVELYYDGSKKIETTSTGATVNGLLTTTGNLRINGSPAWAETGGDYGNLSIRGTTASSSGFLNLGNGAAATNSEFDLARIKIHNGATEVARITGITGDGNNDSGEIWFATQASGGSLTTALVIDKDQNVGIGTTSPGDYYSPELVVAASNGGGITIKTADNHVAHLMFADGSSGSDRYAGYIGYNHNTEMLLLRGDGAGGKGLNIESDGDVALTHGNLVVANGKGIDFGANANATGNTSNLLDDYESGTWTATMATGTCTSTSCKYIKIGNQCTVWGRISNLSDTSTNIILRIEGLPYACNVSNAAGNKFSRHISADANCAYVTTSEDISFYGGNSANDWLYVTHLSCGTGTEIYFYATYRTEYPGSN